MTRNAAAVLQAATALLALAVFVFLLWEPQAEGRNAHATLYEVYFQDTFLIYAYAASIAVFVALYQAFNLFGEMEKNGALSLRSLAALRTIRYCAFVVIGFVSVGEAYLVTAARGEDDIAGGVAMGVLVALVSAIAAIAAARFERRLRTRISARAGI